MKISQPLMEGRFIRREGRFRAYVEVNGKVKTAHVHDPGRLTELLVRGATVLVRPHIGSSRKTELYMVATLANNCWVLVDSVLHVKLAEEAIRRGVVRELRGYEVVRKEVKYGDGRLDLLLKSAEGVEALVEVKGCTLSVGEIALFPDAPTLRGKRHLKELAKAVRDGYEGYVLFLVARCEARELRPNYEVDPGFAEALKEAFRAGVKPLAYKVVLKEGEVNVTEPIPVKLEPPRFQSSP